MTKTPLHRPKSGKSNAQNKAPLPSFGLQQKPERIAKRIARAGICSRRRAEELIAEGRVVVNGKQLTSPACLVSSSDKIEIDGSLLPTAEGVRLWRYYKPRGLIVSHSDEKGRRTVFDDLPADLPRVISIGRLDYDSEGLLLLTNDGGLARHLEMPSTGWIRKYRVRVRGQVDSERLATLENGITIDGIRYGAIKARLDTQMPSNAWLTVAITEGKNREIRNIMDHLGYPVSRLIRLSYGPFQLGTLAEGDVVEVKEHVLADQLGQKPPAIGSQTQSSASSKPILRAQPKKPAAQQRRNRTSSPRISQPSAQNTASRKPTKQSQRRRTR